MLIDRILQYNYEPGSAHRKGLEAALAKMASEAPFEVPCIINGKEVCQHVPPSLWCNVMVLTATRCR